MPDGREQLQAGLGAGYALERELGRGGMATVYLAVDTKHHRPVALKVLHSELAATLGPDRFRREIEMAARLQHPHILSVFDSGETPSGQLWFTMPYVEGETLRDRLRRERQLPVAAAIRIAREAAQALQYAHEHGVVHRDIKPENLLLTRDGSTLVADFGVARALSNANGGTGSHAQTLTEPGASIGTPAYMSPEQASGESAVDARTDIYALGAVLYEMLTGEPPFTGPSTQAVIAKRFATAAPPVSVLRDGVPAGVTAAVATALARSPTDRYATAAEFGAALETAVGQVATTPVVAAPRRARRVPAGVALLGLGFLVGVGVLFAWRRRENGGAPNGGGTGPVALAVLPFDTQGDTANAYFADGITGEIRGKLSALSGLRVIASASSNEYRRTAKPPDQVGRELGVRYLLTGTVEWERGANGTRRVRVSPELVEVREGAAPETKWRQSFDTTLADVFDVQAAVASRVADKLGVVLNPSAQTQLAARPTQNLAAYDAYLQSRASDGIDPATIRRAISSGQQAVALDSNFAAAWARLSEVESILYNNSTPNPTIADAARQAAERAVTLAPAASDGYVARGAYELSVAADPRAARTAYETAVRLAPSSSVATRGLASAEASEGLWDVALVHARQSAALDPRSPAAVELVTRLLLWLRRYPEAETVSAAGLRFATGDLSLTEDYITGMLGQGDLTGARRAMRDVPPTMDRAALAAFMANYWDLYWVLDSADRVLALALPPSAFDDDHGTWGIVRAQLYWLAGDTAQARRYADTARAAYTDQLRATPNDFQRRLFLGLSLAYLGQRAAAAREGERGMAIATAAGDAFGNIPYAHHVLARLYLALGDNAHSLDHVDAMLAKPYFMSPALLRIDPTWDPLRRDPRFEQLLAATRIPPTT